MKLDTLSLRNFRSLKSFQIDLQRDSAFLIGANGAGKSSLLQGINLVLARERVVTRFDFTDFAAPFEIDVRIVDLTDDEAVALKAGRSGAKVALSHPSHPHPRPNSHRAAQ